MKREDPSYCYHQDDGLQLSRRRVMLMSVEADVVGCSRRRRRRSGFDYFLLWKKKEVRMMSIDDTYLARLLLR